MRVVRLDYRGLDCPDPVLSFFRIFVENSGAEYEVLLTSEKCAALIEELVKSMGKQSSVRRIGDHLVIHVGGVGDKDS